MKLVLVLNNGEAVTVADDFEKEWEHSPMHCEDGPLLETCDLTRDLRLLILSEWAGAGE